MSNKARYVFAVCPEDNQNFWDINQELKYLSPYDELLQKEGKRRSSRIMTAIWMIYDPKSRAKQSGRDEEDVRNDIAKNFLNEKNFPWGKYKKIIDAFKEDCRTKLEKEMYYWEMELAARRVYQRELPWETERKEKDEMLKTQKILYNDYLEVLSKVEKERSENLFHGTHKSLLEK
ncbi:MAG: hypothetical protein J5I47_07675 [Vicingus serpentipes]|nr:hypothetical protein [Vicingus serpentipes]